MSEKLKVETDLPEAPEGQQYPNLIATNAVLSYLREIFMALDNMSFQIRTTMNSIINTDGASMSMENPNDKDSAGDPIMAGINQEENENND